MYFGFDLYRDDSIEDLDVRLERINAFLTQKRINACHHRNFGAFLLPPKKSELDSINYTSYLFSRQSNTQYRLCIEFFDSKYSDPIPTLELIYNLGKKPDLYDSLKSDVSAISYLCAYPDHEEVVFIKSATSLSILFKFSDTDPNIKRIKNHLEFLIPNISNKI